MFAVVTIKGNQYKVAEGDTIHIAKLDAKEGDKIQFDEVLVLAKSESDVEVGAPFVSAVVNAKVVSHGRDDKVRVVKMKKRKRYLRMHGHRQHFTEIEIGKIEASGKKAAPAKKAAEPKAKKEEAAAK